jgi:hypothetical protein
MAPSTSSSTYYSTSSSSYSSTNNGQTTSFSQSTHSDPSGTRVYQTVQEPGQAPREEHFEIDSTGRRVGGVEGSTQGRIQDVTDGDEQQKENDRKYEERMEEEYAKREGGA